MIIGHLTDCFYPVINGVTLAVDLNRRFMREAGHEAYVFSGGPTNQDDWRRDVIRSPGIRLGNSGYYLVPYLREPQRWVLASADIVHCHHPFVSLSLASRYTAVPVVYTNHTRLDLYLAVYTGLPARLAARLARLLWPALADLADATIAPTRSLRKHLLDCSVDGRVEVIHNGIDVRAFRRRNVPELKGKLGLTADAPVLLYVGRLATEKSIAALIDQYAQLHREEPTAHLLIVGFGPSQTSLEKQVARMGLASAVTFTGRVSPDEVVDYLSISDLFVTMSDSEVMSLTMLEAMAAGLPVVAPDSVGTRDVVEDGYSGCLVTEPVAAWREMLRLLRDDEQRRRLAAGALARSDQFDIRDTVRQTVGLYESLLAEKQAVTRARPRRPRHAPLLRALGRRLWRQDAP